MRRSPLLVFLLLSTVATFVSGTAVAQGPDDAAPTERVDVRLVLIETLVLDRAGRTVPGLGKDDFVLTVDGKPVEIDVLDETCPAGAQDDPKAIEPGDERATLVAPGGRRVVLAFDYFSNYGPIRQEILDRAAVLIERDLAPGDEVMIVALAGDLRIEQRFTSDRAALLAALDRMEHDVTLWAWQHAPLTDRPFFESLATLLAVLAEHDGPKAVVLLSAYRGPSANNDLWYRSVAERAAAARTVFYPADTAGLAPGTSVGAGLARLANESGGRLTRNTNDFALAYTRAQRDLSCRYAVGFYLDAEAVRRTQQIRVRTVRAGLEVRAPEAHRAGTDEERLARRVLAAFVEPGLFDDPLVRAHVFPMRPASKKKWNAIVTLDFRPYVEEGGLVRDVGLTVTRDRLVDGEWSRRIVVRPGSEAGVGNRLVTLVGDAPFKPGEHVMTVVLADPEGDDVRTTRLAFTIPEVPKRTLDVRGPILARVDPSGVLFVFDDVEESDEVDANERADDVLAEGTVEPMLVSVVAPDEDLLIVSDLCAIGVPDPRDGTVVEHRVVRDSDGTVVHRTDAVPVALEGARKLRCQRLRDRIDAGTLAPGEYRVEVVVSDRSEPSSATPLAVR